MLYDVRPTFVASCSFTCWVPVRLTRGPYRYPYPFAHLLCQLQGLAVVGSMLLADGRRIMPRDEYNAAAAAATSNVDIAAGADRRPPRGAPPKCTGCSGTVTVPRTG